MPALEQPSSGLKLELIPKVNKTQFISSFLDTQKLHAKSYAEEGRALWNSLDHPEHSSKVNISGFTTPILVARNAESSTKEDNQSSSKKQAKPKVKTNPKPEETAQKKIKKHTGNPSEDNEIAARLSERRNRKRAKYAIVRQDNDDESAEKKDKVASSRKNAAGLALMHGFIATNVGKNRLTAPPPVLGVFSKGKASAKTPVGRKNKKVPAFLESVFLGETLKESNSTEVYSKPSSSERSSSVEMKSSPRKVETRKKKTAPSIEDSATSSAASSSSSDEETTSPPARAESEVWNIEREGFTLPSQGSSTSTGPLARSVVVNTQEVPWGKVEAQVAELEHDVDMTSRLSSSLAPSQSASQHGLPDNRAPLQTSKYFPPRPVSVESMNRAELSAPPAPSLEVDTSVDTALLCSPQPTEFLYLGQSLEQRPISPSCIFEHGRNPLVFSDTVDSDGLDGIQPDQQIFPDLIEEHFLLGATYPSDFYIPPRVDAPPLQSAQGGAGAEDSGLLEDGEYDLTPTYSLLNPDNCNDYEIVEEEQSEVCDPYNEALSSRHFAMQLSPREWQYEGPESYLLEPDDVALFEMGDETEMADHYPDGLIEPAYATIPSDDCMDSTLEDVDSIVESLPNFLQGRELLLGLGGHTEVSSGARQWPGRVARAEADVARTLKGHWLPQRF